MTTWPIRPEGFEGDADARLPGIRDALQKSLARVQKDLTHGTLKLARADLKTLAALLVDFGEDLHCGIGIWRSLERYHHEFFGTPLPFLVAPRTDPPREAISPDRVRHFLWVVYPQMVPDLILSPDHVDLVRVAAAAADVLQEQFADAPSDSGAKTFLGTPNDYGWEVKRKLIWLGTRSYLFRVFFERYAREQDAKLSGIAVIDDFLCQEGTEWAGLGTLEILASVLDLAPERRADLLSWSERHNAVYKVLSGNKDAIEVLNLINDRTYRVCMDLERNPFKRGACVHASLVPWDGEWYWSGTQETFPRLDAAEIERFKASYRSLPTIFYRYSPDVLAKAREFVCEHHEAFVARHGKGWVVHPDGLAMAAD
jgi:hypothetical protein